MNSITNKILHYFTSMENMTAQVIRILNWLRHKLYKIYNDMHVDEKT